MANKQYRWFLTKRNRTMKKNNPVAKELYTPQYKPKVVKSKKIYDRKDDESIGQHGDQHAYEEPTLDSRGRWDWRL